MEPGDRPRVEARTVTFDNGDGDRLEGDLLTPPAPSGAAVVCHPHSLYGGTRHDPVVSALCQGLTAAGRRVLRFDFRGAGGSAGTHDGGSGERADLLAAIEVAGPAGNDLIVAGYSFGADIALATDHPDARGWLVVAPPLAVVPSEDPAAGTDDRPTHVLHPQHDQFNPIDRLRAVVDSWPATTVHQLSGADHFLHGTHAEVAALAAELSTGL